MIISYKIILILIASHLYCEPRNAEGKLAKKDKRVGFLSNEENKSLTSTTLKNRVEPAQRHEPEVGNSKPEDKNDYIVFLLLVVVDVVLFFPLSTKVKIR